MCVHGESMCGMYVGGIPLTYLDRSYMQKERSNKRTKSVGVDKFFKESISSGCVKTNKDCSDSYTLLCCHSVAMQYGISINHFKSIDGSAY